VEDWEGREASAEGVGQARREEKVLERRREGRWEGGREGGRERKGRQSYKNK